MAELYRLGITTQVKSKTLPVLDQKQFLGFDGEDRCDLYCFAVSICAHTGLATKKKACESFVMEKSIPERTLALLILSYFVTQSAVAKNVDMVGRNQRKELVTEYLNPMADAGFAVMREMASKPEDVVIAKQIKELDEMYATAVSLAPELGLPEPKAFTAD